jgi:succinoglycan biosynthesis transport protein ExoP
LSSLAGGTPNLVPASQVTANTAVDPKPLSEQETELNVGEYLAMVRRHWKLVAAVVVVAVTSGAVHFSITPKEYQARATLQIERRSLNSPLVNAQNAWFENVYNPEFYPTQYELLKSRGLAERVVRNLELPDDPLFNPGAALRRSKEAGATTADDDDALVGRLADRLRGGLSVQPVRNTQLVELSYRHRTPEFAARAANAFAEAFIDMGIEDRYATAGKASTFIAAQIETLKQEIQDKETQLQAFSRRSDIVALDPQSNPLIQRLQTLNQDYMAVKMARIEKEAEYQEVLATPKETVADSLSAGLVSDMRSDLLKLEQELATKSTTLLPEHPAIIELKGKADKLRRDIDQLIEEKVAQARGSASAGFQTARRQEQALEVELSSMKGEAMDQSSAAVEYSNLKVEVDTRRGLLNELLRKQSETEVTARLQDARDSNVKIIDRALVPGGPYSPLLRKDLSYGLLLGLLFGVGCALLIEFLDRSVKTPEEVERRIGLPTLAVIPDVNDRGRRYGYGYGKSYGYGYSLEPVEAGAGAGGGARVRPRRTSPAAWLEKKKGSFEAAAQIELVPHERPRTPISEAYRSLRTALLLSSTEELKVLAVTSAEAGEGKTTTATNLAVVMAQLGRQVLLVDADLRKPRLHQVFRVSNRVGLVNCLTGAAEADIFQRTDVPNLWLTPSGPIPPNPSELLASDRMREWTRLLRGRFDTVIFDTPPVLAVTDAILVGVLADGVVLTLRAGKVAREDVRACRDRLQLADIRVLGVVLNRHRAGQGLLSKRYYAYDSYGAAERETRAGSAA